MGLSVQLTAFGFRFRFVFGKLAEKQVSDVHVQRSLVYLRCQVPLSDHIVRCFVFPTQQYTTAHKFFEHQGHLRNISTVSINNAIAHHVVCFLLMVFLAIQNVEKLKFPSSK